MRSAEAATRNVAIRTFILVLSAGGDLQRDRISARRRRLRHRLMRNFLGKKVGQTLAIASLFNRLEASSAERPAVGRPGPLQTGLPLLDGAVLAEPTAPITSGAEQELHTTSRAIDDPICLRRHQLRNRRLLDMELRPC